MSDVQNPTQPSPVPPPDGSTNRTPQRRAAGVARTLAPNVEGYFETQKQFITAVADNPNMFVYTGSDLVDRAGVVSRRPYEVTEAYAELARLGPARKQLLNRLKALGAYGNAKPSASGLEDRDINAMADLLLSANSYGRTYDVALELATVEFGKKPSGGVRFRPTPKQDLRTVFRNVSQQVLGRDMSDAEADRFVRAYQAAERREAMGGERAPDVELMAQQTVEEVAPEETAAAGALTLASAFDSFVKGLG